MIFKNENKVHKTYKDGRLRIVLKAAPAFSFFLLFVILKHNLFF
jgi:hypothetical protein